MGTAIGRRQPVLVGAAALNQPAGEPGGGLDTLELIAEAARQAVADAGGSSLSPRVGRVYATGGLTRLRDPGRAAARAVGAPGAATVLALPFVSQQSLLNAAMNAIASGRCEAALVCGGETRARDDAARRAGIALDPPTEPPDLPEPDEVWRHPGEKMAPPEKRVQMVSAVQQYAVIDSARRAAHGWALDQHRDDIAGLWQRFSEVAATNPDAAFGERRAASWLREPGADNRPLAFPYNKWHSTQWSVDQAAALLFTSAGAAGECGVPRDRWVFPSAALESTHALSLSRRRHMHRWPAMGVIGAAASARLGHPLEEIPLVELYSCFPAAVRVQQAELGLPAEATPTVTGGMPFAGGPFNNFVFQSTAAMVRRVRSDGCAGLVTGVSGLLTKPGLTVYEPSPPAEPTLVADLAESAAAATEAEPLADDDAAGRGQVAAYTVAYHGFAPASVYAVVDLADGAGRTVAALHDPAAAAEATRADLIGASCQVDGPSLHLG